MNKQPKALQLADALTKHLGGNTATQAAAELRRLHEENQTLKQCLEQAQDAAVSLSKANIKALEFIEKCLKEKNT